MTKAPEEIQELLTQLQDAESKLSPKERLNMAKELTEILKNTNAQLETIKKDVQTAVAEGKKKQDLLDDINSGS